MKLINGEEFYTCSEIALKLNITTQTFWNYVRLKKKLGEKIKEFPEPTEIKKKYYFKSIDYPKIEKFFNKNICKKHNKYREYNTCYTTTYNKLKTENQKLKK